MQIEQNSEKKVWLRKMSNKLQETTTVNFNPCGEWAAKFESNMADLGKLPLPNNGKLIVFEGVEGCGKTSQIRLCGKWLYDFGIPLMLTSEPGGTELGCGLRRMLLENPEGKPISKITELLLYAADRAQHVEQELKPGLEQGRFILCDRYTDSTIAYQGYGRGLDPDIINQLNYISTGGLESDLTIWLDVDPEEGLSRKRGMVKLDRIEREKIEFHHLVRQGYVELAQLHPCRIVRVDGSLSIEDVQSQIRRIFIDRFFPALAQQSLNI